ncbi:MAG: pitrilysin family protein, partial [Myxococcota bacterium]|nr:pitrilysin family protein [Myxococcota bacterium]
MLALAAFLHGSLPARAIEIPHERYQLDNGMQVILHEDHSLPQVVVNLWYQVGSRDEEPGRSGFAHLFEHLMFMGTDRVPESQFDQTMEAHGGWNNAWTSEDATDYYDVGPANLLETLIWLEADRLDGLAKAMTQQKLDLQRDVVRNELRQSVEDSPYGEVWQVLPTTMFPSGHPYAHPVIGSHEDLEAATLEDVVSFFHTWYVPNNASLVIAGDFDPASARETVQRLFGHLEAGELPRRPTPPETPGAE